MAMAMANSQIRRLITSTSNLVLRFQRPAIRQCSENARLPSRHRSLIDINSSSSSTPAVSSGHGQLEPIRSSSLFSQFKGIYFNFDIPGVMKEESDEAVCVFLNIPGVDKKYVDVRLEHKRTTDLLLVEARSFDDRVSYTGSMKLPDNVDKKTISVSLTKGELMKDGVFKLTLPKLKDSHQTSFISNLLFSFRLKLRLRFYAALPNALMPCFRSVLIDHICLKPFMSFSFYKEETAHSLNISLMPGADRSELTSENSISVSLSMPEVNIQDVNSYLKHDALFIERKAKTKTKKVHYVTGIRLPKSFLAKRSMMKAHMQDGMYQATLSHVPGS